MPFYNDLGYYVPNNVTSYSPYTSGYSTPSSSYSSSYSRAIMGTYTAPPPRSSYISSIGSSRHYKPMLKSISESPYQTALRTNAMTSLTRMNSGKYKSFMKPTVYIPPRPIQMNTADIDVSASKFLKNRNVRMRSTSPEPTKTEKQTEQSSVSASNSNDTSAFMPRVDQNDPPHRSTIKRDRHIVRLSTMRIRSKSRSKSRSIEKRTSSKKSRSSHQSTSSKKSSSDSQPELEEPTNSPGVDESNVKKSWRDKFGDSLQTNTQKVARKTPGELILEKHIIRDKKNEEKLAQKIPTTIISLPETVTTHEITYLEPMIRKSIRRQSLIKCPSFKDICNDISSDIKVDDDLNAGELRRRASLIIEQEDQILAQLVTVTRRPSADLVNVDVPILEMEEPTDKDVQNESHPPDGEKKEAENVIVIKKKTKKKDGKVRHKISVSVDVDNPVVPVLTLSPNCETGVSPAKTSPKWKAVVEEIEEDHTIHKVFKLPKKRSNVSEGQLKKSESGEDFWKLIDRRESIHYKKKIDLKRNEMEIIEVIEQEAGTSQHEVKNIDRILAGPVEAKPEATIDEQPVIVNKERRRSSLAIKSRSINDMEDMKEQKKKLKSEKPKSKITKKREVATTPVTGDDKKQVKTKARGKSSSDVGDAVTTPAKMKSNENNTKSNVSNDEISNDKISNKISDSDSGEKLLCEASTDELKIISGPPAKGKATACEKSAPRDSSELKRTSVTAIDKTAISNEKNHNACEKVNEPKVEDNSISPSIEPPNAVKNLTNGSALPKATAAMKSAGVDTKPKKLKKLIMKTKADAKEKSTASAPTSSSSENENRKIGNVVDASSKCTAATAAVKSSITIKTVQHDVHDKDAKSIVAVDANNNDQFKTNSAVVALSKFATVSNLNSSDLSTSVQRIDTAFSKCNAIDDDDYISGEETFDLLLSSDSDENNSADDNWEQCSDTEPGNEMGLKRRHKKKKDKFDPKRVVKLDHKRKCYVIEEAPKYPLIATPRPLQKKYHFFSESETESDGSDSDCGSSDGCCYDECLSPNDVVVKDVIRMSTCSNDSGFEGGGTAPSSPKKMLGKHPRAENNDVTLKSTSFFQLTHGSMKCFAILFYLIFSHFFF